MVIEVKARGAYFIVLITMTFYSGVAVAYLHLPLQSFGKGVDAKRGQLVVDWGSCTWRVQARTCTCPHGPYGPDSAESFRIFTWIAGVRIR